MWPTIVFVFVWCTLVYNFVAYWVWSPNGWAYVLGSLDHAGGVPVHMTAGTSALVYSFVLGRRQQVTNPKQNRPQSINNVFIGTALSWFGWFGFNGGSGLVIGSRAALACVVTNLAACTGGFTWCMLDYFLCLWESLLLLQSNTTHLFVASGSHSVCDHVAFVSFTPVPFLLSCSLLMKSSLFSCV